MIDIEQAIQDKIIDPRDYPARHGDYDKVRAFLPLKGRPDRPVVAAIEPRRKEEFDRSLELLGGQQFFEPFNRVLEMLGRPRMRISPDRGAIDSWNPPEFVSRAVSELCDRLDRGDSPLLVPRLVALFLNLERERQPSGTDWSRIGAIAVPGSRTIDRAAEAFRAYIRTGGNASIITSGRVPYYDKPEDVPITEAEANAAFLRLLGVPNERIVPESTSRDTEENVEFLVSAIEAIESDRQTKITKILLVTSPFHLARYRLNAESLLVGRGCEFFALGSKASRYWAETYFLTDSKSIYTREDTIKVVFNEYIKIAFDVCAVRRTLSKEDRRSGVTA